MKRLIASAYLVAGVTSAFICLQSLLWAVWGAPTHWTQYVGLLSSLVVASGAGKLLVSGNKGQRICVGGVLGMGVFYIPAVESLVPAENIIISPLNFVIVGLYPAFVAAMAFYPQRIRGAGGIVGFVVLAMVSWAGLTAHDRWNRGEFNRPQIVGFLASRNNEHLVVPNECAHFIPSTLREDIAQTGIGGLLNWCGSSGDEARRAKLVVIATSRVPEPKKLYYPRQGTVVYVWNGVRWASFPADAGCYPAFATLQVDGMISNELATGGVQGSSFFPWQKPE